MADRITSWFRRIAARWDRLDDTDEDARLRAGKTTSEWYREVIRPRSMREHGCETVEEYEALLASWCAERDRKWKEDQRKRDEHARALWPKDKPYRSP